jgi:hypothetical protein
MEIFSTLAFGLAFLGRLANKVAAALSPRVACLQARDRGLWGPDCGYPNTVGMAGQRPTEALALGGPG